MHIILDIIEPKIQHVRISFHRRQNLLLDYPKRLDSWIFNRKMRFQSKYHIPVYFKIKVLKSETTILLTVVNV